MDAEAHHTRKAGTARANEVGITSGGESKALVVMKPCVKRHILVLTSRVHQTQHLNTAIRWTSSAFALTSNFWYFTSSDELRQNILETFSNQSDVLDIILFDWF